MNVVPRVEPLRFASVEKVIERLKPAEPVYLLHPGRFQAAAKRFLDSFPGDTLYAVKCNPDPSVLRAIWAGGVRHFDCASPAEIALVRSMFPDARIHFMHPIKTRGAIREAWTRHDVHDFVLDSA
ncbi:MAG TPA: hypothetical protein VHZ29_01655, partial [Rhizomicrobium sp.]|nr:hypothetical protein [Rhizomicrobium sp.]